MSGRTIDVAAAALAAALLIATTPLAAQQPGSRQTRDFIQAAAQSDEFEIMEATTALAESHDPQVRSFAQAMIQAHLQTTTSLRQAVANAGLEQPKPDLSGDQSMFLAALQSQRGADFDKTYVRQQILAHSAALTTEQGYATAGDVPTIRDIAASTVPIITSHLRMAEQMMLKTAGS